MLRLRELRARSRTRGLRELRTRCRRCVLLLRRYVLCRYCVILRRCLQRRSRPRGRRVRWNNVHALLIAHDLAPLLRERCRRSRCRPERVERLRAGCTDDRCARRVAQCRRIGRNRERIVYDRGMSVVLRRN